MTTDSVTCVLSTRVSAMVCLAPLLQFQGAAQGALHTAGVEPAPAGRHMLVRTNQVDGAGLAVVALGQNALHIDDAVAMQYLIAGWRFDPKRPAPDRAGAA